MIFRATEYIYVWSFSLECVSNTYQSIKAVITQRAKWDRVIARIRRGEGPQPPAETPQPLQEHHLPHLPLKMFDSRRSLLQMTFYTLCSAWSRCVNMLSLCNAWTTQTCGRNKGTSVRNCFKQSPSRSSSVKAHFRLRNYFAFTSVI